jgi:enoyl-CoA hydratase/carnithine racemase
MSDASEPVVRSEPGRVCRITLNRPDARNAVSAEMLDGLRRALGDAAVDPACRVVLLAGAGRDFCAGADIGELQAAREGAAAIEYGRSFEDALAAIGDQPQPVIAAIHGSALGAGCQIAVAADLAVAAEDARIGIPSGRLGVVINYENVERLVMAVGPKRAGEILLAARTLSGSEAAAWGLVNRSVPAESVASASADLAEEVAGLAPLSVRASKRGIRAVLSGLSLDRSTEGHRAADFDMLAAAAFASGDLREGLAAFRERRPPEFTGD